MTDTKHPNSHARMPASGFVLRGPSADIADLLAGLGATARVQADGSIRSTAWYRDGDNESAVHWWADGTAWRARDYADPTLSSQTIIARALAGQTWTPSGVTPATRAEPAPLPDLARRLELVEAIRRADELPHVGADLQAMGWRGHEDRLTGPPTHLGHTGDRFAAPVRDAEGKLIDFATFRPGEKVMAGRGRRRDLYPAPEEISGDWVLLVEGEKDAITATLAGLPSVAIPGVGGASRALPERFKDKRLLICLDCDEQGRDAAGKISRTFTEAGVQNAIHDLDPERHDGFDVSDFAREHGLDALREEICPSTAGLLDELTDFLRRYVVFADPEQAEALALWILHAWAIDAADVSPYIIVSAPERRAGKTRLRDVIASVVPRPWQLDAAPTEAVLFRKVNADRPTVLLDEADALFNGSRERVEPLRAILNAGHARGATVPRCVGDAHEVVDFEVFAPKVLVGIDASRWPDTIRDRAIVIQLRRKLRAEGVERFRRRDVEPIARRLRDHCQRWATPERIAALREAWPELPDELDDRAADGWEPLLAIADDASPEWAQRARDAARALAGVADPDTDSPRVRLLRDIAEVFHGAERLHSEELAHRLRTIGDAPWGEDPQLTPARLADLLRPLGIRPRQVRIGPVSRKGYEMAAFSDALARYVGGAHTFARPSPETGETPETSAWLSQANVSAVSAVSPPSPTQEDYS